MIFGRKTATVAAPIQEPASNGSGTVSLRELEARLDAHDDEFRYMKQRFQTLQARLMSELRELRRLVDSYEPAESEGDYADEEGE